MEFRSSLVALQPGMYILRHPKGGLPPLTVARAPGNPLHNGRIETLSTSATDGCILRDGADCIVMHVIDAPVDLLVTACLDNAGSTVPTMRIDKVGLDEPARAPIARHPGATLPSPAPAAAPQRPIAIKAQGLSVIAHVERSGDTVGHEGELVGAPNTTLRLEGFQLMWPDRPPGVDIAYHIAVEGLGMLPTVQTGKFCGTRGQARRITEVTFALVGPQADEFQLEGTAYFSGGFQVPVTSGLPASGPSGLEHLTALSLRAVKASPAPKPAMNPWDESAKTKVFKAPNKAPKAAAAKKPISKTAKAKQA